MSINLIGRISHLKHLNFIEKETAISCNDYSPWTRLTNLEELDLRTTGFAEEDFLPKFRGPPGQWNIKFKNFLLVLPHLKKLAILNLRGNSLFPESLEQKNFGRKKADKAECAEYHGWRKHQIEECAQHLVSNFRGKKLIMEKTKLGEIFITAFENNLAHFNPLSKDIKFDFSGNYIPLDNAAHFIIAVNNFPFCTEINFSKSKCRYSLDDLKNKTLEILLNKVTFID